MKTFISKHGKTIASVALTITKINANSTCINVSYQPKLPKNAEAFRRK